MIDCDDAHVGSETKAQEILAMPRNFVLENTNPFTGAFAQLGQFLGTEHQQGDEEGESWC